MIEYTCGQCQEDIDKILKKIAAFHSYLEAKKQYFTTQIYGFDEISGPYIDGQASELESTLDQFNELFEIEIKRH